jgi:hypothetical protein
MTDDKQTSDEIAEGLTRLERELFMGEAEGWGSWMFGCAGGLCLKGLGRKENGSIYFDTPLANEVRAHLERTKDA